MKEFFKDIKRDKTVSIGFAINGFIIIAIFILILFSYRFLPPFIPIFNQLPWGETRLGSQLTIFIPILIVLLIFVINLITGTICYAKIPLASRMLAAVSLLVTILTGLFIVKTLILIL